MRGLRDKQGNTRREERLGTIQLFLLAFTMTVLLLPGAFVYYKRVLDLPEDLAVRGIVVVALVGMVFAALSPGFALGIILIRLRWMRAAKVTASAWFVGVFAFLGLDRLVQSQTGNHLYQYTVYLDDPKFIHWAGNTAGALEVLSGRVLGVVLAAALAWVVVKGFRRFSEARLSAAGLKGLYLTAIGVWVLLALAGSAIARLGAEPNTLSALNEELPLRWNLGFAERDALFSETQARAAALYRAYHERIHRTAPGGPPIRKASSSRPPDIVFVVIESYRHDAMTQQVSPKLMAWVRGGTRLAFHTAGSNASHYGLYILLYGLNGLNYFATLDAGVPPTLPSALSALGYELHYLTSSIVVWQRMEDYLGPEYFNVRTEPEGKFWERDRRTLGHASRLLAETDRPPRFLFVFLVSTHFGYQYPPEYDFFQPAIPKPSILDLSLSDRRDELLNRYRNSSRFLDDLVGTWFEEIDLTRTLVILTGDHGESLFDDGTLAHSSRLSRVQTLVPMLMAGPGIPQGRVIPEPTSHVDIVPTLLHLLGFSEEQTGRLHGDDLFRGPAPRRAYAPSVFAKSRARDRERVLLASDSLRFSVYLDHDHRKLRFLGKTGINGNPSSSRITGNEGEVFLEWLRDFLERSARGVSLPAVASDGPPEPAVTP